MLEWIYDKWLRYNTKCAHQDLRVMTCSDLSWNTHIIYISQKAYELWV